VVVLAVLHLPVGAVLEVLVDIEILTIQNPQEVEALLKVRSHLFLELLILLLLVLEEQLVLVVQEALTELIHLFQVQI
jgi:hypothetical protein